MFNKRIPGDINEKTWVISSLGQNFKKYWTGVKSFMKNQNDKETISTINVPMFWLLCEREEALDEITTYHWKGGSETVEFDDQFSETVNITSPLYFLLVPFS